jgi:hypothetical protein
MKPPRRVLLLSIDPLAALAERQEQLHARMLELTPTDSAELEALWRAAAEAWLQQEATPELGVGQAQFLILISCRDEQQQLEPLERLGRDGLECRALRAQHGLCGRGTWPSEGKHRTGFESAKTKRLSTPDPLSAPDSRRYFFISTTGSSTCDG